MPKMPDEQHAWIGRLRVIEKGDDGCGTRVPDHVELTGAAVGELDGVLFEADDAALMDECGVLEGHGWVSP
jgi:hypothetical protein